MVGCEVDQIDVSPQPSEMLVIRLRRPDGSLAWVSMCGAFDLGLTAIELRAGDRLLTRIENAKWKKAQEDRLAAVAARRAAVLAGGPDPDGGAAA